MAERLWWERVFPKDPSCFLYSPVLRSPIKRPRLDTFLPTNPHEPSVTFILNSTLTQPFPEVFASVEFQVPTEPKKGGLIPKKNVLKFIGSLKFSWDEGIDF